MTKPMKLGGETCPICHEKTLTLSEEPLNIPFFGKAFLFGMNCSSCKYKKADLEAEETKKPAKFTLDITTNNDLNIRVVKSSRATIKIPHLGSIEPGPASEGYITTVEGVIQRIKRQIEHIRDSEDDSTNKKKAKNLLKKIQKIFSGTQPTKLIIEDPTGNSAIISEKAVKTALKGKK